MLNHTLNRLSTIGLRFDARMATPIPKAIHINLPCAAFTLSVAPLDVKKSQAVQRIKMPLAIQKTLESVFEILDIQSIISSTLLISLSAKQTLTAERAINPIKRAFCVFDFIILI